jgi:hypothetical protein
VRVLDQVINKAQATIPMDRQVQGLHLFQKAKKLVLGDKQPVFVEEKIPDVDEVDLTAIDVSNPFLWRQGQWQSYFKRLRDEAPVHYQADSAFGPYWSIARYDDLPVNEPFDWVDKVSIELTSQMFITLLDLPYEQCRKLVYWTDLAAASASEADVVEGTPDHRDSILSKAERERGDTIMLCVSRSLSKKLVLDV